MVKNSFIDIAVQEALRCADTAKYRLGSVVFKGKRVFYADHNYDQSVAKSRFIDIKFLRWQYSIHSEQAAIIGARRSLNGCSILTVRIRKDMSFGLARPCKDCIKYIGFVGIKNVFYSVPTYPFIVKLGPGTPHNDHDTH